MKTSELVAFCKEKFVGFPKLVSNNKIPRHIQYISNMVQWVVEKKTEVPGKHKLLQISIPPRNGKTELVSKHFTAWFLMKYPRKNVIMTSYSADLADSSCSVAKEIFETWGNVLFGVKPHKSMFNKTNWRTEFGGGCKSAGVGGAITGFGADCAIFYTNVLTKYGYRPMNTLKIGDEIWSFNHETERLELKRVENIRRKRVTETIEVKIGNRHKCIFTPEHPYYTTGREYIKAGEISKNDEFIEERISTSKKVFLSPLLWRVWSGFQEARLRIQEEYKRWSDKLLLFAKMCIFAPKKEAEYLQKYKLQQYNWCTKSRIKVLRHLQEVSKIISIKKDQNISNRGDSKRTPIASSGKYKKLCSSRRYDCGLQRKFRKAKNKVARLGSFKRRLSQNKKGYFCFRMHMLRKTFREKKRGLFKIYKERTQRFLLFKRMFKQTSCYEKQKNLHRKWMREPSVEENKKVLRRMQRRKKSDSKQQQKQKSQQSIWRNKAFNKISRWLFLLSLWCKRGQEKKKYCSSFGLQFLKRFLRKPSDIMLELSFQNTSSSTRRVTNAKIKKNTNKKVTVYDIQVEGNHNFFAEGILVHNCFLIDDFLKGIEDSESKKQRDKIEDWFKAVASTRLHPGATVIIIATRWHSDDLIGRLKTRFEKEGDEFPFEYHEIFMPAICEDPDNDVMGRKKGEALWPAQWPLTALKNIMQNLKGYYWNSLYQQNPVARGGNLFKTKNFRYWTWDEKKKAYHCWRENEDEPIVIYDKALRKEAFIDPALEMKSHNDPTGMVAVGYCQRNKIFILLDARAEKIDHTMILFEIEKFCLKNKCIRARIENEKLGKVISKQSVGKTKTPIKEISHGGQDKYARAVPIATAIDQERVFFPQNTHWISAFETELVQFPSGAHDEYVDCLAYSNELEGKMSLSEILASAKR